LGDTLPLFTLLVAIGVAVWIGGYRPALLVAVLGYLACHYLFIQPRGAIDFSRSSNLAGLFLYLATAAIIVFFGEALSRATQRYRRGEAAARQHAELLRTTLASIGDGVITTDAQGRITSLNAVAEELTGWTNAEVAGKPLTQVFHIVNETTRLEVENPAMRALKDGVIVGLANHTLLIAKDGTERPIDDSAAPIRTVEGEVAGCVLVFRDISERHRAEADQRTIQEQIAMTLESVTDGFMRYDRDWRIVYVNAEAERINRRMRSEMLGRNVWEVFPSLAGTHFEAEFRRAVRDQVTVEFENYYEPFHRWYSLKGYPTPDGGLTSFIRDITEQKVAREALERSEARLRWVFESNVVGMIQWDLDRSLILDANETFLQMTGYTREDVDAGRLNFRDMTPPEWTPQNEECIRTIREHGQAAPYEKEYFRKDGSRMPLIIAGTRFDDSPSEGMSLIIDISDRKRVEQEIARIAVESERQRRLYETVLTNTPDFMYVFSLDHKVVYANDALIKMWGRGYEGAIGKTFLEIGYEPWHAEMHDREIDQVRATRQPIRGEVPFHGTLGVRQYDYIFVPVIGADGEVEAVAGTTRDVTERKETERQWREGQEQLDFALAAADLGYWSLNLADHTTRRTLRHDQIFGYDALLPEWTYEMFLEHVVQADRAAVDAAFQQSLATGAAWAVECRIRGTDGGVRHIWKKGLVRRDAEGKVEQMLAIIGDITDRRQAEEAIRESEARHSFAVTLADTLRPLDDPTEVQAEASRVLGEYLGANRVVYFEICGEEYLIERDYNAGVPPLAGRYPVAAFGTALLDHFLVGRTVIEADATTEPDRPAAEQAAFAAIQVRGHVYLPLVKSGRFVAGMTVHFSDRRDWTRLEVALIEETAERTWAAVERVRAEAALRTSEEARRLALDAAELGAFNIDLVTHTLDTDERFRVIFAGSTEPLDYEQAFAAIHADDRSRVREAVAAATRPDDPAPYAEEYRVIHPDGSVHWVFAKGRVNHDRPGQGHRVATFDGTIADITARKLIEEERERLVSQLRDQDKRKDEFLATLAHELRNPLAPIHNGLQIIGMAGVEGAVEEARSMMERQVVQLVRLVDDLLDVSRVTSGKLVLRKERVELKAVIDAAIETSRPVIEQGGHELAVDVPDRPIHLDGDALRLAQVVSNLLNNSAKYTRRGGHISLAAHREEGMAVVVVADDGVGIPPHMVGRVFEMFTQVDRTLEKTTGGLGIGLSLVKGLVEMHGGTIEARSEGQGRGSQFILRLPVAVSVDRKVEPSVMSEPVGSIRRRRILVADDNVDSARSLGRLLELNGNEVRTVNDGLQAVEAAEAFEPEVVLLDIGMPELNGYEVCRRIRTRPWGKNAILVAMTGWGQEEDKRLSHEAGFNIHLVKPVEFGLIKKLLASLNEELS
jgi:PAS domain S-box-containing protein